MIVGDVKYKVAYEPTDVDQVFVYLQLYGYAGSRTPSAVKNGVLVYAGVKDIGMGGRRLDSGLHIRVLRSHCFNASVCILGYDLRTKDTGRSLTEVLREQSIDMCNIIGELVKRNGNDCEMNENECSDLITVARGCRSELRDADFEPSTDADSNGSNLDATLETAGPTLSAHAGGYVAAQEQVQPSGEKLQRPPAEEKDDPAKRQQVTAAA